MSMTLTPDQIANVMESAAKSGASLYNTIREHAANGGHVDVVAEACSAYKRAMSDNENQKAVNNVINQVSRQCRELWGYSIVCTSRRDSTYAAVPPKPKAPSTASGGAVTHEELFAPAVKSTADVDALLHEIANLKSRLEHVNEVKKELLAENSALREAPATNPSALVRAIVAAHGKDEAARLIVDVLKESD